jgi:hypothetical protein
VARSEKLSIVILKRKKERKKEKKKERKKERKKENILLGIIKLWIVNSRFFFLFLNQFPKLTEVFQLWIFLSK